MEQENLDIDLISLDSINILNAGIQNDTQLTTIEHSEYDILFQFQLAPSVSVASRKIKVLADFEIRVSKKNADLVEISSHFVIAFLYTVKNLEELTISAEDNFVTVDEELVSSLLNITYSSSRGIIYTRSLGTAMEGLILPVISTADLLHQPASIRRISGTK
jgi:hypothetical protein